ncbi:acyl-CoA dehydrogenase family protein [Williamsia sp.]|uniref:acyl-CoA dehydrogenase family protein n=1 Tax=Williamsia sp. TaxID=1872085 RepID=UPI002F933292
MSIAPTTEHIELSSVVEDFTNGRKLRAESQALLDAPEDRLPRFWREMAEVGWLGLHLPEEYGGSGCGIPELVVVVAELGRAIAPRPILPTVIGSPIIARSDADETKSALLPQLADGTITAGIGIAPGLSFDGVRVSGDAGWFSAHRWPTCWYSSPVTMSSSTTAAYLPNRSGTSTADLPSRAAIIEPHGTPQASRVRGFLK